MGPFRNPLLSLLFISLCIVSRIEGVRGLGNSSGCMRLRENFLEQVFLPLTVNYTSETQAYWSTAAWLEPDCVFSPSDASDLAAGLKILVQTNTTIAIRSGGHAPITGIANTNHGVLIGTTNLQTLEIVPSPNDLGHPYVRMGSGVVWGQVYDFLSKYQLLAVGARLFTVGSGSILGGGMSFLSQQKGWIADNVINFELVTGNGDVLQVNDDTHPELFWALKGGGNNFGIVTRFDLKTYEEKPILGINIAYPNSSIPQFMEAMSSWMVEGGGHEDSKGSIMPSTRYIPATDTVDAALIAYYDEDKENPAAFENFTKAVSVPAGTTGIQTLSKLVDQTEAVYGQRAYKWNWYSTCIKFSNETIGIIIDTMANLAREMIPQLDGFVGVAEEPVSGQFVAAARANGGDAMDLDPTNGGFIIADYYVAYNKTVTAKEAEEFLEALISKVEEQTKAKDLYYPFYWLNTLGARQSAFDLYGGGKSLPRLWDVSKKYDPDGVFQRLVYGFKLDGTFDGA